MLIITSVSYTHLLIDPPRPEAYAAVKSCQHAGIRPIMITGDHKNTAAAIGKELGICQTKDEVITGRCV